MEQYYTDYRSIPSSSPSCYASTSDVDSSFTSSASTSFTTPTTGSARSSFGLSPTLLTSAATSLLRPLPHHSHDPHWQALLSAPDHQPLHLHLLRPLGSGSLARVYHCRLPSGHDFALKVVDLATLPADKLLHAELEADVLAGLDHPFLPTLYARLRSPTHSCLLLDYCPGGDLHSLLRRQPSSRFPLPAARFFAAEVLLALEYLHLHGLVYRDLKPENVLRRPDGHLMLSDFDLCFRTRSPVSPSLRRATAPGDSPAELVAEPAAAEKSFEHVGTHEYLAPEVLGKDGHGAAVDWWAFGVLLYEMLYGRTPFRGRSKESTLRNIKTKPLVFPKRKNAVAAEEEGMDAARDLMARLLVKDPGERMGSAMGAAEIKRHPFFQGIKWALIRCYPAPVVRGEERQRPAAGEHIARSGGEHGRRGLGRRLVGLLLGRKGKHKRC